VPALRYDCVVAGSSRDSRPDEGEAAVDRSGEVVDRSGDVDRSADVDATDTSGEVPQGDLSTDLSPASVDSRSQAQVGRVLSGRYRIDAPIATGGMGTVFRGWHLRMRKKVAIKLLHAETQGLPELVQQFEREAIAGAHVTHPNVAIATDFGELDDGSFFLVLEFVRGVTLAEVLEGGRLPLERAVTIGAQIANALHACHELGIIHRDVKPRNVMLVQGPADMAKLIDFGFAKVPLERVTGEAAERVSRRGTMSDPDTVFGTIGYLAPEAAEGMSAVDARSDLYALGVILYEMITGKKPFEAAKSAELFFKHRTAKPPSFRERAPEISVPPAVEAVVMRLLEKSPQARYQSGADVTAAFDRALGLSIRPPPPPPPSEIKIEVTAPPTRWGRIVAVLVMLAVVGGIWWYAGRTRGWFGTGGAASGDSTAAEPTKTEVDGLGGAAWAGKLLAAPAQKDWRAGAKALAALAELDPRALRDGEVAKAAAAVAVESARGKDGAQTADDVFTLLSSRFGADGLDVLFTISETKGAGDAQKRANGLLRRQAALDRATPALKIAIELRDAPCEEKTFFYDRAASDGDKRALAILTGLKAQPCKNPKDPCCFAGDKGLDKAIAALGARLK
jgi:eukaryotic-like serine/threonine-protein kinase